MFKGHPWENNAFGPIQYYWHLKRGYCFNILFELDNQPFIKFCKDRQISPNQLIMKISYGLSKKYLPQYVIRLNKKPFPARYPTGYVRKISAQDDMLEYIAIRDKESYFEEKWIWKNLPPLEEFLMKKFPRFAVWLASKFFPRKEMRNWFTLMVTRNPMAGLGIPIVFFGNNYWCFILSIPFGEKVWACFGGPHAFGNVDYYKEFIADFKNFIEHPETIPNELIEKEYRSIALDQNENSN